MFKRLKKESVCSARTLFCYGLFVFAFSYHSLEELYDFNDRDDRKCKSESDAVFVPTDRCKLEQISEELDLDYASRENKREDHSAPEEPVVCVHSEDGATLRTHVHRVEDLSHAHGKERHCNAVRTVSYTPNSVFESETDEKCKDRKS